MVKDYWFHCWIDRKTSKMQCQNISLFRCLVVIYSQFEIIKQSITMWCSLQSECGIFMVIWIVYIYIGPIGVVIKILKYLNIIYNLSRSTSFGEIICTSICYYYLCPCGIQFSGHISSVIWSYCLVTVYPLDYYKSLSILYLRKHSSTIT